MAQRTYEVETVRLTAEHVARAAAMVASGATRGRLLEFRDLDFAGLVLRVGTTSSTWYLRLRARTVRLGDIESVDLRAARMRAATARQATKAGSDPREFLSIFDQVSAQTRDMDEEDRIDLAFEVADHATNPERQQERRARASGTWTWQQLTDAFLERKLKTLKEPWRSQYEGYLRHPAFEAINGDAVQSVGIADLEKVRDAILAANSTSTAFRAVQQGKEMLSWAWKYKAAASGLEETEYEWWQRWSCEHISGKRSHTPTVEELARTLVLAERYRSLGEEEHKTSSGTLAALWAVVLTAQRTGALVALRRSRLFASEELPEGWQVGNWTADEMKGTGQAGLPHALPLPPAALEIIRRYADEQDAKSPWLFPSGKGGGHVTKSALNRLLYRLEGRSFGQKARVKPDREGKPGPKPRRGAAPPRQNLLDLHDIRVWTPHDVRRALGDFLDERRLGGGASAILAHRDERTSKEAEKERALPITRVHYSQAQKIELKAEGLALWVKAVNEAYEREVRAFSQSRR